MALVLSGSSGISAGGTNWILSPQSSGRFNLPYQPVFYAYNPSALSTSTAGTIFPFNTTRVNVGGHYSTSTYKFTAPILGWYEFHAGLLYRHSGVDGYLECSFYKNGANIGNRGQMYVRHDSSTAHCHSPMHHILQLAAGDTIDLRLAVRVGGDIYYGENLSYFSGKLIG